MVEPVKIREKALKEIKNILSKKGIPNDYGLRIGVKGGKGCLGVTLTLGFDKEKENDLIYKLDEIFVLIQKSELLFMIGKEIDFYEGGEVKGFLFVNEDQPESSTEAL